jgi:hypothetical protein
LQLDREASTFEDVKVHECCFAMPGWESFLSSPLTRPCQRAALVARRPGLVRTARERRRTHPRTTGGRARGQHRRRGQRRQRLQARLTILSVGDRPHGTDQAAARQRCRGHQTGTHPIACPRRTQESKQGIVPSSSSFPVVSQHLRWSGICRVGTIVSVMGGHGPRRHVAKGRAIGWNIRAG